MISQFFILSPRGDTIVARDYLGNVPKVKKKDGEGKEEEREEESDRRRFFRSPPLQTSLSLARPRRRANSLSLLAPRL